MDAIVVGILTAGASVVVALLWQLMVRPDATLAWWAGHRPERDGWFEHHPGAVRALRIAGAGIVFLLGFLTGLALTFLRGTSGG